jgi:hypothetical protein
MEMNWSKFKIVLNALNAVSQAKGNGIDTGEIQNTTVTAEWNDDGIEFNLIE